VNRLRHGSCGAVDGSDRLDPRPDPGTDRRLGTNARIVPTLCPGKFPATKIDHCRECPCSAEMKALLPRLCAVALDRRQHQWTQSRRGHGRPSRRAQEAFWGEVGHAGTISRRSVGRYAL